MYNLKAILLLSSVSILVGSLVAIPFGFGVGTLTALSLGSVSAVGHCIFFSKPKGLKHNSEEESKPFMNVATEETSTQSTTQKFEITHKMEHKPTFRGEHQSYENNSNENNLNL